MYHNCRMYAASVELLCYTEPKKLAWYVGKGRAEYVDSDGGGTLAIRLLFQHT